DRSAGEPPAPEARRRRARPPAHQDRAQRGLSAGRRGDGRRMTPGAYLGSMSGRVFMILVAGVVATTLVTQGLAERDRRELMEQFRIARMADRTAQLVSQFEAAAPADRRRLAEGLRLIGVVARLDAAAPVQGEPDREL